MKSSILEDQNHFSKINIEDFEGPITLLKMGPSRFYYAKNRIRGGDANETYKILGSSVWPEFQRSFFIIN